MSHPSVPGVGRRVDAARRVRAIGDRIVRGVDRVLPEGRPLADRVWDRRHAGLVLLLWLHAVGLTAYATLTGPSPLHGLAEGSLVVAAALLAGTSRFTRKVRAGAASFGFVTASAFLVHVSGGYVEMHFHFFVVVALMALYQDRLPFLLAICYVVLHHGVLGVLTPTSVYNHPSAWEHPWTWAMIHGGFVLAASGANLLAWRLNEYQALHDPLTNLANRDLFKDRVEHALARMDRSARPIAVLFLDLDRFKAINDSAGHTVGDLLLCAVADRLRACVRAVDTVARLGGDEFAILLDEVRESRDAVRVAQQILDALAKPFDLGDRRVLVGASIGIRLGVSARESPETLVRDADMAMYAAKNGGRGRYALFESSMHAAVMERVKIEADLRSAVERDELELHYQPIVDLGDGRIVGVEALVRWVHPGRGLVSPAEFIPAAEESGLIVPMGRWILREACRQVRTWHDLYPTQPPMGVSVNLSPKQFLHQGILRDVAEALRDAALAPDRLLLEVTEGVLMEDTEVNIATLHSLKALGVRLAIDDFGTGYSSLSYLRRFPIDIVKIDKSFIDGIAEGPESSALARAIITMGHTLHLHTVAEGVEHAAQYGELRKLGCDLGQGYHFARPLTPAAIGELLAHPVPWEVPRAAMDDGEPDDGAPVTVDTLVDSKYRDAA